MSKSLDRAITANPIEVIEENLHQLFGTNTVAAMHAWLTLLSGLTPYPLAAGISGRSSAGKSFIVERVAELMPRGSVAFASRISVAGLFAMPRVHSLVTDELATDEAFRKIRRQLISTGRAEQWLATSSGESRHDVLKGPISILDVTLADKEVEFQDRNRMLVCQLDESDRQVNHNSVMVVQQYSAAGRTRAVRWGHLCETMRTHLKKLHLNATVDLPDVLNLVRQETRIDAPRRLNLLCRLSCVITILRQANRRDAGGILYADPDDVQTALDLLLKARLDNDQETLPQYVANFLSLLQRIAWSKDGLTIENLQQMLNAGDLRQLASTTEYSPGVPQRNGHWTQRMIDCRLHILLDNGLVSRDRGSKPYLWQLVNGAASYQPVGVFDRIGGPNPSNEGML